MLFDSSLDGEMCWHFYCICFEQVSTCVCVCVCVCVCLYVGGVIVFLFEVCFIIKIFLWKIPLARTSFLETSKRKYPESEQGK
jgi:hypothetical protein